MKNKIKLITRLSLICLCSLAMFSMTGCDSNSEYMVAKEYTVTYDYGIATNFFNETKTSDIIEPTEWITNLPTIKDEYSNIFLGWYINGTDKKIENYDFIGDNITLYAKFDVTSKYALSGLYQNGKYVQTWASIKTEYPNAFVESGVIKSIEEVDSESSITTYKSYLENLDGELVIDSEITKLETGAIYKCDNLKSVIIPSSVTTIESRGFSSCKNLENIIVDADNTNYKSENNCLLSKDGTELILGCMNSIIPNTVTKIKAFAFSYCERLNSIIIPSDVTNIGIYAFNKCAGLTSIIIPSKVTNLGMYSFNKCTGLKSITISSGETGIKIDYSAFSGCTSLTSITIPSNVTEIVGLAFTNCTALQSVVIDSSTIAKGLTSKTACGCLIENATKVYIKTGLDVSASTYLNSNFTKNTTITVEDEDYKEGYDLWVINN